jgi:hypothetical protein
MASIESRRPLKRERKVLAPVGEKRSSDVGDDFERKILDDGQVACCEDCGHHICSCSREPAKYSTRYGSWDKPQPMTLFQAERLAPRHAYFECEATNSTAETGIVLLSIRDKRQSPPMLHYERVPVSMLVPGVVELIWKRLESGADKADADWFARNQPVAPTDQFRRVGSTDSKHGSGGPYDCSEFFFTELKGNAGTQLKMSPAHAEHLEKYTTTLNRWHCPTCGGWELGTAESNQKHVAACGRYGISPEIKAAWTQPQPNPPPGGEFTFDKVKAAIEAVSELPAPKPHWPEIVADRYMKPGSVWLVRELNTKIYANTNDVKSRLPEIHALIPELLAEAGVFVTRTLPSREPAPVKMAPLPPAMQSLYDAERERRAAMPGLNPVARVADSDEKQAELAKQVAEHLRVWKAQTK